MVSNLRATGGPLREGLGVLLGSRTILPEERGGKGQVKLRPEKERETLAFISPNARLSHIKETNPRLRF